MNDLVVAEASARAEPELQDSSDSPDSLKSPDSPDSLRSPVSPGSPARAYRLALADSAAQVRAAQALRFAVFNLELREGLSQSYATGRDADAFDAVCDHLLVEHVASGQVVGTYRMQTGDRAARCLGYYSEREFDFRPFEPLRAQLMELGRACIHVQHRNLAVLTLLWKGIARHARANGARYLIGCSSLASQDAGVGAAVYRRLQGRLAPPELRTRPLEAFACPLEGIDATASGIPRLLAAYLALGAVICSPPAIDHEFRTIDFLTIADLHCAPMVALQGRERFGGPGARR